MRRGRGWPDAPRVARRDDLHPADVRHVLRRPDGPTPSAPCGRAIHDRPAGESEARFPRRRRICMSAHRSQNVSINPNQLENLKMNTNETLDAAYARRATARANAEQAGATLTRAQRLAEVA